MHVSAARHAYCAYIVAKEPDHDRDEPRWEGIWRILRDLLGEAVAGANFHNPASRGVPQQPTASLHVEVCCDSESICWKRTGNAE